MPKETGNWTTARTTDLKPWQTYYRDLGKTNLAAHIPVTAQSQSPAADVLLALSKYDPVIEKLWRDSALPFSRFPVKYDTDPPAEILIPHLAAVKRYAQVLQLRAIAELQNGQSEKAMDDVKLLLRLAESIHNEPFLISHLVRIAILQITLQPVYEGLAKHEWSDEQLVALDSELAKLDLLADYKLSMRGEMGLHGGNIDYLIRNRRELFNMTSGTGASSGPPFISSLIPTGWFYQNRLGCARMVVEYYIPVADVNQQTVSPAAVRHADEVLRVETKGTTPYNILERMLLPALGNAVKKFAYAQSSVDLARVAIALERYRLAHGEYPESLNALAPQFMEKVPRDVIGGGPLKYRRTSDGQFVLYSIGWNERDDGGVVGLTKGGATDINQGDWVWRYPQK
jgi:tetratricopeptide (TPR) repeat protein